MIYKLEFLPSATKEWRKLGATIQRQLKKKLVERLEQPRIPAALPSPQPHDGNKWKMEWFRRVDPWESS